MSDKRRAEIEAKRAKLAELRKAKAERQRAEPERRQSETATSSPAARRDAKGRTNYHRVWRGVDKVIRHILGWRSPEWSDSGEKEVM